MAVEADRFAALRKQLEREAFRQREEATHELRKLGDAAEPALRKALQENLPLETRRRLRMLLDELGGTERLCHLRAIEVLKRIQDRQARELLSRIGHKVLLSYPSYPFRLIG